MSIWQEFGFERNLYATQPLEGTPQGSQLLVGRDPEVKRLMAHWSSLDTHASVEGDNGVGKTSLVVVAAYRAMVTHSEGKSQSMILPLLESFQLRIDEDLEERVLFAVARSILHHEDALKAAGKNVPKLDDVRTWLNEPILRGGGGNVSILGVGGGGTYSQSSNTAGFSKEGFRDTIKEWLRQIFPNEQDGAFVGVIDNLELSETSQAARQALEAMRDNVVALHFSAPKEYNESGQIMKNETNFLTFLIVSPLFILFLISYTGLLILYISIKVAMDALPDSIQIKLKWDYWIDRLWNKKFDF